MVSTLSTAQWDEIEVCTLCSNKITSHQSPNAFFSAYEARVQFIIKYKLHTSSLMLLDIFYHWASVVILHKRLINPWRDLKLRAWRKKVMSHQPRFNFNRSGQKPLIKQARLLILTLSLLEKDERKKKEKKT